MGPPPNWRDWIPRPQGAPLPLVTQFPEQPGLWDLAATPEVIPHWTRILRQNLDYSLRLAAGEQGDARSPAAGASGAGRAATRERVAAILTGLFDDLERGTGIETLRTIHEVTLVREHLLRSHGFADPYQAVKTQEAERLLPAAAERIRQAWSWGAGETDSEPVADLLAGLLAGNLFDLGSALTQKAFREGRLDCEGPQERFQEAARSFLAHLAPETLERLCARPRPLAEPPEGRILLLADNAGADFLLGLLPAALFWARRWEVCLVVNSLPVASDISLAEAGDLLRALGRGAESPVHLALAHGRLHCIPSGTGSPGIDLRYVGAELIRAAGAADWILLDGQGRGVETNWSTRFRCGVLRSAVVKDRRVAEAIGARAGDPILRWDDPTD